MDVNSKLLLLPTVINNVLGLDGKYALPRLEIRVSYMYAGRKPNTYKIRSEIRSQIRLTVVRRYVLSLKKSRCADRGFADSAGYAVLTPSRALAHLRMQRVRNAHPARALSLERCPHTKTFTPTDEWSKIAAKALTLRN